MQRVRLLVGYDGERYHGWQIQQGIPTVEGTLRSALSRLLGCAEDEVVMQGASRTDAGVHAIGQTVHVDHDTNRSCWDFVRGLNAMTPDDIGVFRAEPIDEGFNARHSSGGKTYHYRIWSHRFGHPLDARCAWWVRHPLDLERMQRAADQLVGEHDYAGFRASDCQSKTTVRQITSVRVEADGAQLRIVVEGNAFLKYMVRIISGTLVDIARGHLPPDRISEILRTGDRRLGGQTAPPHGLTLIRVHYPDHPWLAPWPEVGGAPLADGV